jgi:hypothetical protein
VKKRKQVPPHDSVIVLQPGGEGISINAEQQRTWQNLTTRLRETRGNVLADCFQIEMQLDRVLCELLFPSSDDPKLQPGDTIAVTVASAKSLRALFDELVLKSASMPMISFSFKITLLGQLEERIPALKSAMPLNLVKTLDAVRKIRNNFAHYPVAFMPRGKADDNQTLEPVLCTHRAEITLDQEFFDRSAALFQNAIEGLRAVNEALRSNFNREEL